MDMLDQILEKLARSPQDKDIEDRKGTQPKKYYAKDAEGDEMSKSTKQARARHFEKGTKKDDDDPSAYEPAPGDKSAKTKPSQHTKKFKKMFGENYDGDMAQNALENIIRNANNLKRVVKEDGDLHCLDAKLGVDGNALYRQKAVAEMNDPSQEDAREAEAAEWDLNYVALDGNIGCMVNGAGLAMGTMDIVALHGGFPANFLDVGGGATKERVAHAFKLILSDDKVKAVLVNIFGGIVRCDMIAEGIIGAVKEVGVNVPVVVRLEGTNADLGKKVLDESGLDIIAAESLTDAAVQAVKAAGN